MLDQKATASATTASIQPRSGLVVLTASDVDIILAKLDLELALSSQKDVFTAFSESSSKATQSLPAAIQIPHRSTLVTESQKTLVMPSRADELLGCKFVAVPKEGDGGLPGSTVVLDAKTGKVKGLVDARRLTALRNACGSALSVRACPPTRDPEHLLIFGSGAQAQAHAIVFLSLFPTIQTCTLIVRQQTTRAETLLSELQAQFPKIKFTLSSSSDTTFNLSQAVHNANIILTLVPTITPLFNSVDVTSGTHIVLVGSYTPEMRDVEDELIKRGGLIMVDSKEACLQESGELISAGLGSEDLIELGAMLGNEGEGLRSRIRDSGDVTIFKSVSAGDQAF